MADLCLDEFTDHGHCGVLEADGTVDNDATLEVYAEMALVQAAAGVDVVGPSGMMDGQVGVIRDALEGAGHAGRGDPGLLRQVRLRLLRPLPRGRGLLAEGRPPHLPAGPGATPRGCPRGAARRRGGRRHGDGQAGAGLPRRAPRGRATRSTSRWRPTTSPASTPWSRPPPRTAGSTATPRSWRRSPRSAAPAPTSILTYWAAEVAARLATQAG